MSADLSSHAERGMSAPPEVVYSTATDPHRADWLPTTLRRDGSGVVSEGEALSAEWRSRDRPDWSARLRVDPVDAGGARVRLDLTAGPDQQGGRQGLTDLAEESLDELARVVADNLTAG